MGRALRLKLGISDVDEGGGPRTSALLSEARAAAAEWLLGIAFEMMPKRHPHRTMLRNCLGDYMRSTTAI